MTTLIYVIPVDDLFSGIITAADIHCAAGISPKIISGETTSVMFNVKDAQALINDSMDESKYIAKHRID
jgi:hypothetical protein